MKILSHQHVISGLTPLLLALAISNAYAAPVTVSGDHGAAGTAGTEAAVHGTAGAAGQTITFVLADNSDAFNSLHLVAGYGGTGGAGNPSRWGDDPTLGAGTGGAGGAGGQAGGAVYTLSGANNGTALATIIGGNGGDAGLAAQAFLVYDPDPALDNGGNGGAASSTASAVASGAASVVAQALATGGNGGATTSTLHGRPGQGGAALAQAYGRSDTGNVAVTAIATGGNGGNADLLMSWTKQAAAGTSVALENAVAGATRGALTLTQHAVAGSAGVGSPSGSNGERGGYASSTLTLTDAGASALIADVAATAGNGVDGPTSGAGGAASSYLALGSLQAGASVRGSIVATGGAGGYGNLFFAEPYGGAGGAAEARGVLSGLADVTGQATASGGAAHGIYGLGGNATAQLSITAGNLATGTVAAYAGLGQGNLLDRFRVDGAATASLTLVGAGAQGSTAARGAGAGSSITASTTGALAVDVAARALGTTAAPVTATAQVNTGPGTAAVNAMALADGAGDISPATATVNVVSAGAITGTSTARGGYPVEEVFAPLSAAAVSTIRGETSGAHAVTLSAFAYSDRGNRQGAASLFGNADASAYGRSGSGVVDVTAYASGGRVGYVDGVSSTVRASATAVTRDVGGISRAAAFATGGDVAATAQAQAIIGGGRQVSFRASTQGARGEFSDGGYASSTASSEAISLLLPENSGRAYNIARVGAASDGAVTPGAAVAAGIANVAGAGVHAGGFDAVSSYGRQNSTGEFQFLSGAGEHLLLGFIAATVEGAGFDTLDLTISNHGTLLFSQTFTSVDDANLFFTDRVLDLGVFGAGAQNLSVSSSLNFAAYGGYAFSYVLGTGAAVSAVPEPSAWWMMMLGIGGVLLAVRRRRTVADATTGSPAGPTPSSC